MAIKREAPEQALHNAVASYLSVALGPPVFWTTFPAGGGGRARGGQLKRAGLKAGVPDIMLVFKGRAFFIELKTKSGRLSPAQIATHAAIFEAHGCVEVCRSLDEVEGELKLWGIPLRVARVA